MTTNIISILDLTLDIILTLVLILTSINILLLNSRIEKLDKRVKELELKK